MIIAKHVALLAAEARAAGVRAEHWPSLVCSYLELTLGRAPSSDDLGAYLQKTRAWSERAMRARLARGAPIH